MKLLTNLDFSFFSTSLLRGASALLLSLFAGSAAMAASSDWVETEGGKLRLISGGAVNGQIKAGLEIVLDEGWKTYWKVPGDAGIPPVFDFEGGSNVAKAEVRWPVPVRYGPSSGQMLGYKDGIIFPILVTPKDEAQSVALKVQTLVGLCSDLCVPLSADLDLVVPGTGDTDLVTEMMIDRDLALVPGKAREDFQVIDVRKARADDGLERIAFTARIPKGYGQPDLFVEGPQDWLLPLPQKLSDAPNGGEMTFELVLDGLPKGADSAGEALTVTLTNGDDAIEQVVALP